MTHNPTELPDPVLVRVIVAPDIDPVVKLHAARAGSVELIRTIAAKPTNRAIRPGILQEGSSRSGAAAC